MKKNGRRILSVILTAVMVFALLPVFGKPMVVKAETTPTSNHAHGAYADKTCSEHAEWSEISSQADLKTLCEGGGNGYLKDSINVTETINVSSGKEVSICLNGYSITQNADKDVFYVEGTLNLFDEVNKSGKITHEPKYKGTGVNVEYGIFNMYGGKISGNTSTNDDGGGVYVKAGTFNMYGGTISENTASEKGGGVYVDKGTFTMTGGKISDNKAAYDKGGGVYVYYDVTFTMEGGTIAGNTAPEGGGVLNYGTFTMNGGTIEKNYDVLDGGGVFNLGTFTMKGGTISGNNADYNGGGVYNTVIFTMTGGTIEGNNAYLGGGVYNAGNFTMTEGTIKDNTAKEKGNGVYSSFSFVKEGGEIDGSIESKEGTLCTVTFNANDESNKTIIQYVRSDKEINLVPNKFTYDYKRFNGWNTERDGSGKPYKDIEKINISNNLILYAQWKDVDIISYDVNFVVNNGSWDDGTKDEKKVTVWRYEDEDKALVLNSSDIPSPRNPDTGYKAEGWETDPYAYRTITSNITYTYNFEPINYIIKYDPNGGDGRMEDQGRTYDDKAPLTTNTFTFEGKTFNGWNTAADGSGTPYADEEVNNLSSTDGDTVTLYAQWTVDTFTITWKDYNGTVLETDTDVAYGTTPSYDGETPKRDNSGNIKYTFSGWTPEIDTVKGATTYTATYSEEEIVEPTEPTTSEEPTNPSTPEESTDPGTEDLTDPEPDPEIPEKDWLDDLRLKLQIANELGGPQTVTYSGDFALSYDIMLYLVEHPDITLIYTVTYEGVDYTITIPGGKALADPNIPWYGPLWLLANYGGDNVPEVLAGSGKYTVVAGDTLSGIVAKFNTTVEELAKKNGIKDPNYIIVGQVIVY